MSILLTAVFSTAAFWFVFSDEQEAEVRQYTDKIISVYNSDSEIDLSKYYGIGDFRVTLIKSDGSVVSDSVDTDVNSMPNHSDRPEFEQAIKDGNGSSHRMSETLNKITYYYAETADGSVIRVAKTIDSSLLSSFFCYSVNSYNYDRCICRMHNSGKAFHKENH